MKSRKKNLLICIPTLSTGGAEKSLVNFINEYKEKYDISLLVYTEKNNYYAKKLQGIDIDYFIKKNYPLLLEKICNRILKYIPIKWANKFVLNGTKFKKIHYDIEFSYLEGRPTKVIAGSSNEESLKLAYIHCDFSKHWHSKGRYLNYKQEYKAYKKYDRVLAVSDAQKEAFECVFPVNTVQVVPNLIDEHNIISQANEEAVEYSFPYFCAVGRLVDVKRFDLLIKAFHQFRTKYPQYNLIILGEGGMKSELESLIKDLGEQGNIILCGFKENPYKYIKNSLGLIQTSSSESFGYVLAEAAILGVPVIATKTQGSDYMKQYFYIEEINGEETSIVAALQKIVLGRTSKAKKIGINESVRLSFSEILDN